MYLGIYLNKPDKKQSHIFQVYLLLMNSFSYSYLFLKDIFKKM